jgi:hypothetical protein
MYSCCIFCSSSLGGNGSIERFPIGRTLAFDVHRGRLWVVCARCSRWNLAPIEERWEAVEEAERAFRDARIRVQRENVGLAGLCDGTRLVRVGRAVPGEVAAWRYGREFVRRRWIHLAKGAAKGAGIITVAATATVMLGSAGSILSQALFRHWPGSRRRQALIHRIPASESPDGREHLVRSGQVSGSFLDLDADRGLLLNVPSFPLTDEDGTILPDAGSIVLHGPVARRVLGRALASYNAAGAGEREVDRAIRILEGAGSGEAFLRRMARVRAVLGCRPGMDDQGLTEAGSLALEMAMQEETERRAMEGELALLEAAWREAEEVAAIADALPIDPLTRLRDRLDS